MLMKIQLSDHFTYKKLFRFAIPSVIMMIFTSIYGVIDGLFVSNIVGTEPFAAINLIMPILMIVGAFGFMMGAGGTAVVAKTLGEKRNSEANSFFSFIVYVTAALGIILALLGFIFMEPLCELLGAEGKTLSYCISYGRIVICAMPFFMIQNLFQSFFIAAEKPKIGLAVTVAAGVTNIVLDALFVALFNFGLEGAAIATSMSQFIGGVIPIFYFSRKNTSLLHLGSTKFCGKVLIKSMTNGSSELMSNISMSVVTLVYNFQLLKIAKENGVAAYGVIMYVSFIFIAIFIGYSISTAPIIGFHYGAKNREELKNLFKKSSAITLGAGLTMSVIAFLCAYPFSLIFVGDNEELLSMTVRGFRIFSASFIFSGFCIFSSSMFTALNNGPVSAVISFMRTLVYQLAFVILLPMFLGLDGIWLSMLLAEALAIITSFIIILIKRKKYGYL